MTPKILTKQEQLNSTKLMHDIVKQMQEELPGKYYTSLEQLKNSLALVNNSIAAEMQEAEKVRQQATQLPQLTDVPCGNGTCTDCGDNVQP